MFILLLPMQVQAINADSNFVKGSYKTVNENLPKSETVRTAVQGGISKSSVVSADNLSELEDIVRDNMINRITKFSVIYYGDTSSLEGDIYDVIGEVITGDDYLNYSYTGFGFNYSGYAGKVTINFSFAYLTTKSQEDFVDSKVTSILGEIIDSSMNSHKKEKAIHDYIVKNVEYDTSLERYSAYNALSEGKTVCQGYALLAYKMLTEAGVENKIVIGSAGSGSDSEGHAWNLVKLDGKWYHLDCTWDDPVPDVKGRILYDYYNLTDSQISKDHNWDRLVYPSATTIYDESGEDITKENHVSGVKLSSDSLTLKVGQAAALKASIEPENADNKNLSWTSTNSKVAIVDSNGNVEALSKGSTVISVKTEDGGYTDNCQVDVIPDNGIIIDFSKYKKWGSEFNVSKNKMWSIKFTKPFDASTVSSSNVLVYKEHDDLLYPVEDIEVTYNSDRDIIYVKPLGEYDGGKIYYLVITQNVLSKDGKAIPKPIVLTFTIEE